MIMLVTSIMTLATGAWAYFKVPNALSLHATNKVLG